MTSLDPSGSLQNPPWRDNQAAGDILTALTANGAPARFVGGCVRDALLERPVSDFDIATPELPEKVMALLEKAGIRAIPTGLQHGTITAVRDGQNFEITTLRVDVETDGRRAEVAFTTDWQADAARRDFTMNALFCDFDGTLYDPVGGAEDARAGRVRFIGNPQDRLDEDMLRALRFFRFHAWYGKGDPDPDALTACRNYAARITNLSGERLWQEMSKLLIAPAPSPVLGLLAETDILTHLLPDDLAARVKGESLSALCAVEEKSGAGADAIRRLAAWMPNDLNGVPEPISPDLTDRLCRLFVLSNQEKARLTNLLFPLCRPQSASSLAENRRCLYWLRREDRFQDLSLFGWAFEPEKDEIWRDILALPETSPAPEFPLGGDDVLALGVSPGAQIGSLLSSIEAWWVTQDFEPDRASLIARLAAMVNGPVEGD